MLVRYAFKQISWTILEKWIQFNFDIPSIVTNSIIIVTTWSAAIWTVAIAAAGITAIWASAIGSADTAAIEASLTVAIEATWTAAIEATWTVAIGTAETTQNIATWTDAISATQPVARWIIWTGNRVTDIAVIEIGMTKTKIFHQCSLINRIIHAFSTG